MAARVATCRKVGWQDVLGVAVPPTLVDHRLVGVRVDATPAELVLDGGIPEVLDPVVRPPRQARRDQSPAAHPMHEFPRQW